MQIIKSELQSVKQSENDNIESRNQRQQQLHNLNILGIAGSLRQGSYSTQGT